MRGIMANYIGVDVGKSFLQIYLSKVDTSFSINNNEKGFKKFISYLKKHYKRLSEVIVVFEPTGGYETLLKEFLKKHKISSSIVHPTKVRNFAKATGLLAKTDKIDSKLIHNYAASFNLPASTDYSTDNQKKLHSLIKRRGQLILFRNQEIARADKRVDDNIAESIKDHLLYLDGQLKDINQAIENLCNSEKEIQEKMNRLISIPGVGKVLATAVICQLPELGNIQFSKLTSLIGLAPFARSSGKYNGKRKIFAGRSNLRKVLYMAAVASLRCNHKLKAFYDKLIDNHKPPKVALVAVMRKILAFMNALFKHNSSWNNVYNS